MNKIHTNEHAATVLGVSGRMHNRIIDDATGIFRNQKFISERRAIRGYNKGATLQVAIRFDDECKNGHQTFSITAEVREPGMRDISACGCLHDEIAEVFPEFAPLIKWHLVSTDGPMHYIANTCYHASDRDSSGRAKGEPSSWDYGVRFDDVPLTRTISKKFFEFLKSRAGTGDFQVIGFTHERDPKTFSQNYSLVGFGERWHDAPFHNKTEADEFCESMNKCKVAFVTIPTAFSNGKERELDHARGSACWPEATDEQLSVPRAELEKVLQERLPGLIAEFRATMDQCGFMWEQEVAA